MLQFDPEHISKAIEKYKKDIDTLIAQAAKEGKQVTANKAQIEALRIENEQLEASNREINKKLNVIDGVIKSLEGLQVGQLPKV